jgi:hypothetical protein
VEEPVEGSGGPRDDGFPEKRRAGMNQQDSVGVEGRRGMGVTLSPEKDVL